MDVVSGATTASSQQGAPVRRRLRARIWLIVALYLVALLGGAGKPALVSRRPP